MKKWLRMAVTLALFGLLLVGGGCGGGSSSVTSNSPYPVVDVPGAVLPVDPTSWTLAEKQAWIEQGSLLLDQMTCADFRGRMTGDIGYDRAATWAAANFEDWGLEPLGGSYFQEFLTSYSMPVAKTKIDILVDGIVWKSTENGDYIDDEFVKDVLSAHGTNTGTVRGKVTFLGYGIDATSANTYANREYSHVNAETVYRNDFNEYVGMSWAPGEDPAVDAPTQTPLDVTNRVVIFKNATPNGLSNGNNDYRTNPIGGALSPAEYKFTVGNDWIRHEEHYIKIAVARQRNAAGVLYNLILPNPNIRYQPSVGANAFQIAMVGSIGRDTSNGTLKETDYGQSTLGNSRLLNDLFAKQLEIEAASSGAKHTLTDLIARASAVKQPATDGNGAPRTVPTKDFGDGNGPVQDYAHFLYQATADLFRGPDSTVTTGTAYDKGYDASIASNSFHFDDRIEIRITTVAETKVNARGLNVVGMVRGEELPNEYVVYMSHFDHSGLVGPYMATGAADNGAGCTANMLAARYAAQMAAAGNRPKRSLVFILDGAEESGMDGAKAAAAWFVARGKEKVKAVFHTDSTFGGNGNGNITLSANMSTSLSTPPVSLPNLLLNSSQGREHPWGQDGSDFSPTAGTIIMGTPIGRASNDNYVGRPRTDAAAWIDAGMAVLVNVSASQVDSSTSLYHAPYDDRAYVGDHLMALLGIATAQNMYTVANQ